MKVGVLLLATRKHPTLCSEGAGGGVFAAGLSHGLLFSKTGAPPATGTGTLLLTLQDVNDNGPEPDRQDVAFCSHEPEPQKLHILDRDLPPNTSPFRAELVKNPDDNWAVEMDDRGRGRCSCLHELRRLAPQSRAGPSGPGLAAPHPCLQGRAGAPPAC